MLWARPRCFLARLKGATEVQLSRRIVLFLSICVSDINTANEDSGDECRDQPDAGGNQECFPQGQINTL